MGKGYVSNNYQIPDVSWDLTVVMGLVFLDQSDAFMNLALSCAVNLVVVHNLFGCKVEYQLIFVVKWISNNARVKLSKYITNQIIKELNNEAID
jgi:hypothetical protein